MAGLSAAARELPLSIAEEFNSVVSTLGGLVSKVLDGIKATVGHYLHQFLDKENLEDAKARWTLNMKLQLSKEWREKTLTSLTEAKAVLKKAEDDVRGEGMLMKLGEFQLETLTPEDMFILAVQVVETLTSTRDNKRTDEMMRLRWKDQIERLKNSTVETLIDAASANSTKKETSFFFSKKELTEDEKRINAMVADFKNVFGDSNKEVVKTIAKAYVQVNAQSSDEIAKVGTQLQADGNGMQNVGDEARKLLQKRKQMRRSASDPDLKGKSSNLVTQSVGSANPTQPAMARNVKGSSG